MTREEKVYAELKISQDWERIVELSLEYAEIKGFSGHYALGFVATLLAATRQGIDAAFTDEV